MNAVLFYTGILLAGLFFVISIILFIKTKSIQIIHYFLKCKKVVTISNHKKRKKFRKEKNIVEYEETQILEIAKNYATALMDANTTIVLPSLEETNI